MWERETSMAFCRMPDSKTNMERGKRPATIEQQGDVIGKRYGKIS